LKVYIQEKGIILSGKAWKIRYILKKYQTEFTYVKDWINANADSSQK